VVVGFMRYLQQTGERIGVGENRLRS
jgi:hypothetical protein